MKTKITIEIEYGSPFQKECGDESLILIIKAWKQFRETIHKKNKIKVNYQL